jgi:hypothetical protein
VPSTFFPAPLLRVISQRWYDTAPWNIDPIDFIGVIDRVGRKVSSSAR